MPVRAAGLLGALRLGQRARPPGPRRGRTPGRPTGIVALAGGDPEDVRGEHVTRAAADGDAEALERACAEFALVGRARASPTS